MSETRAVAVLLWLFELARRGPRLKPSIRQLYWGVLVFLALLVLSVSLLGTQFVWLFVNEVTKVSNHYHKADINAEFSLLGFVSLITFAVVSLLITLVALYFGAIRLSAWSALATAIGGSIVVAACGHQTCFAFFTNAFLPLFVALVVVQVAMGRWGVCGLAIAYFISFLALMVMKQFDLPTAPTENACVNWVLPWRITAFESSIAAWVFIAIYLALYALFLQPYLGDAARYFRNSPGNVAVRRQIRKEAVDTLEDLHMSGRYDRVVVVAHSLGTVIAYDMLRAYYSRIDQNLPDPDTLGSDLEMIDHKKLKRDDARNRGRAVIGKIESVVEAARKSADPPTSDAENLKAWLVTDFVTLGSPLTHAHYLMCEGGTERELRLDFQRRVREFEFPTCPPILLKGDGRLTFASTDHHRRFFHHGGLFGLTRWTNIYFPVSQMLWGDAIGGPVAHVFGKNIMDVPVYRSELKPTSLFRMIASRILSPDFFAHTKYWMLPPEEGSAAPHIRALINAINLADIVDGTERIPGQARNSH